MDRGELVGGPDGQNDEEDKAGEIDGSASAQAGVPADVDHKDINEPHGKGEKDLWIAEVGWPDSCLGDERANEQTGGHAGKSEEKGPESDLVGCFQRRERRKHRGFLFKTPLLNEIEQRGEEREQKGSVGAEKKRYVEKYPTGVDHGKGRAFLAGVEGRDEAEKEADGQEEDAEGDCPVTPVDKKEGQGEDESEEGLGLVGVDWQTVVSGVKYLCERDKVKEYGGNDCRDGDVTPAGPVVESRWKNCKGGDAVEDNCDFEPEEGH
jgi:hypothetical protein